MQVDYQFFAGCDYDEDEGVWGGGVRSAVPQPVIVSADLIKAVAEVPAVQVEGRGGLARCIRDAWVSEESS